jgi:hypothetical protein
MEANVVEGVNLLCCEFCKRALLHLEGKVLLKFTFIRSGISCKITIQLVTSALDLVRNL